MRSFFLKLFKWAIILAFLAGAVYGGRQFYRNRQMLLAYLGGPVPSSSEKPNEQEITVGICDRPASLAVYAAVSKRDASSNSQWLKAKRFGSYEELWEALELGTIDYAYVSLDQLARQAFITSPCVIFPYAQSTGSDGIVCSSAWDSPTPGHPRHIACVTGSTGEYIARLVCDKYMDSSTPVELAGAASAAEAQELLSSGQAEALAVCQPLLGELISKGYKLLTNEGIPIITEVCVAKNHSLDSNSKKYALRLFLTATSFRFSENLIQRPGPMYSLIAKISGLKRDEVRATMQSGLSFITQDEAVSMLKS
ncbi:hypothetical protein IJT17_00620, partial [bacterium]|nr:hypothetical protein [bacterium]